jgi:Spy/CpxP family protein refolding chaperone
MAYKIMAPMWRHTTLQERRMKAIRIATLAAALCVGMTSVAAAQGTEPPKQGQGEMRRGGGMGGMLLKDINLTDAQKAQVKTIREKYLPQQMDLRKAAQATGSMDDATRAKMKDLQSKQAAEIRATLTADQQVTFDKNLAEMKAQMEARRNGSS